MKEITATIKTGFEKNMDILQHQIFEMRNEIDEEKKKTDELKEENSRLQGEINFIHARLCRLLERQEEEEQEKNNLDIVIDNVDNGGVSDASKAFVKIVNETLMGEVIRENEVEKAFSIKNKRNPETAFIIATVTSKSLKKAIFSQKKMFRSKNFYIRENLTKSRYQLLKSTKEFASKYGFKYVWSRDGRIFMKKDDFSSTVPVKSQSFLNSL